MDLFDRGIRGRAGAPATRSSLRRIEAALRRIEEGSFGRCLGCGRPIGLHRLEADPAETHCDGCTEPSDAHA